MPLDVPVKVGISQCLLGDNVRYDGGHKLDRYLKDTVGRFVCWIPVCPEVECGLPVPREAMRLIGDPDRQRLVTNRSGIDHTDKMNAFIARRLSELAEEGLCGFVFKTRSPSSGMRDVKIYDPESQMPRFKGSGLFARSFMERFPLIPVEDEGRLHDMGLRENFFERVFVYARWRHYLENSASLSGLIDFHTDHKLLIMSHSVKGLRELGALVAKGRTVPLPDMKTQYVTTLMSTLAYKATVKKNTNVLDHCMGYFKKQLLADEKKELREVIDDYHDGRVPLIVPITLVRHYVRRFAEPYLARQVYLNPHPKELMLRNHV